MPSSQSFDEYAKMRRQFKESAAYQKQQHNCQANKPFDLQHPFNVAVDSIVLNEIHIQGNTTTRPAFLRALLQPAIQATTLRECYNASKEAAERLQRLDIFDRVEMRLQPPVSPPCSSSSNEGDNDNNNMDLSLVVKEKKRLVFATGTAVDQHGVHLRGGLSVKNVFGGAETVDLGMHLGGRACGPKAIFSTPVWSNPDKILSFEIFRRTLNNKDRSSYEEDQQCTAIRYQTRYVHTVHEFSYETTERAVRPSENASYMIRAQCGSSSKRALVHRWILDTRDHVITPTRGHLIRLCQELGFSLSRGARDAKFIKHEIESWSIAHLGAGIYLTSSFQAGYLKALDNPSNICDRYFLGHPISIRGIDSNDIGSHDQGDSLGGDAYVAAGVSLWTHLPHQVFPSHVKANVFSSCGAMTRVFPGQTVAGTLQELSLAPTVAVGVGVAYFQPWGRFECNYTVPLMAGSTQATARKGKWQFGFGIDLL
ncbi:hypothetical protein CPC16_003420 [Podila verticillata]|nr:hypothetical protein CPC16_003420 [Podila verticillata]